MAEERRLKEEVTEQLSIACLERDFIQGQLHKEIKVKEELGLQLNTAQTTMKRCNVFYSSRPTTPLSREAYCGPICGHARDLQSYMARRGPNTGVRWGLEQFAMHGATGLRVESVPDTGSERGGVNTSHVSNPESEITQDSGAERMWKGSDFGNTDMIENLSNLEADFGGTPSSPNMKTTFQALQAYVDETHGHARVASSPVTHAQVIEEVTVGQVIEEVTCAQAGPTGPSKEASELVEATGREEPPKIGKDLGRASCPSNSDYGFAMRKDNTELASAEMAAELSEVRSTGSNEDHWSTTVVKQSHGHKSNRHGRSRALVTESTTTVKQVESLTSIVHGQSREEASDVRSPGSNEGGAKLSRLGRFRLFRSDASWDE